jgi:hypothetical protein
MAEDCPDCKRYQAAIGILAARLVELGVLRWGDVGKDWYSTVDGEYLKDDVDKAMKTTNRKDAT